MVDLQTAMAAASADRQKRMKQDGAERKRRRNGADIGIEAFDPVKHVGKEKAETASMWLVLAFSAVVSLAMRYILMPATNPEKTDVLYMMPLAMIILIPSLHRAVMPEKFKEHYTKGTWFKAGFLHTFTFLALSFLLVNPPMADIVAPQVASSWSVAVDVEGELVFPDDKGKDGVIKWYADENGLQGDVWLLFGLADNVNSDGAEVTIRLSNNDGTRVINSTAGWWDTNGERVANARTLENKSAPNLLPHGELDQPFAILLGDGLAVGTHVISVEIIEQGDPWTNTRNYEWTLEVIETVA